LRVQPAEARGQDLAALEPFVHEFERHPVVAVFGVQAPAQVAVEFGGVDVPEAASLVDVPAALERRASRTRTPSRS